MREIATGMAEEHDASKQALFKDGHRTEELARPLAERLIDEPLYRVVASEGTLSASFDGLTMDGSIAWEHKMLNNDIRAALDTDEATGADLPPLYRVQMEQQCMVSKCERVLFTATRYSPAGELLEERHCWYEPDPALAEQIRAGWPSWRPTWPPTSPRPMWWRSRLCRASSRPCPPWSPRSRAAW